MWWLAIGRKGAFAYEFSVPVTGTALGSLLSVCPSLSFSCARYVFRLPCPVLLGRFKQQEASRV